MPGFNLHGESTINTFPGGVITSIVFIVGLAFAVQKFLTLMEKKDVLVTSHWKFGAMEGNEMVNLNEIGFRVAFTMENYLTKEPKNDPRYVKWIVRMYKKTDGVFSEDILPFHKCTWDDIKAFGPVARTHADNLDKIMSD